MSADRVTYVDSSAALKLVVQERESAALTHFLRARRILVSSVLCRVEVARACLSSGDAVRERGRQVVSRFELVRINERVLDVAGSLVPRQVRSLDAIHLATALHFGSSLRAVITYDARMAAAALSLGMRVASPS